MSCSSVPVSSDLAPAHTAALLSPNSYRYVCNVWAHVRARTQTAPLCLRLENEVYPLRAGGRAYRWASVCVRACSVRVLRLPVILPLPSGVLCRQQISYLTYLRHPYVTHMKASLPEPSGSPILQPSQSLRVRRPTLSHCGQAGARTNLQNTVREPAAFPSSRDC